MFDIDAALTDGHRDGGLRPAPQGPLPADHPPPRQAEPIPDTEGLRPDDTERTLFHMLTDESKLESFRAEREVDFSYSIPGLARFRVNAFVQRGSISLVCRAIPFQIKSVDGAAAAAGDRRDRRRGARPDPADRHHRLGQVDDARGDDRPHQLALREAHRHDRGPGRVPAPRQAVDHQPARGRRGHRLLRPRAAARAAPGPRRDPDRRDARRGDGAHRAVGGRDRPPRAVDDPHRRRRRVGQPHHRLLPAGRAAPGPRDAGRHAQGGGLAAARADPRPPGPRRHLRDPADDRPRAGHDHQPGGDRAAARGDHRGRVLRHADLRPGAAARTCRRAASRWTTRSRRPRIRTTSSCW